MWVTEGIISRDQAESICEYERRVAPSRVKTAEALAYAGSAVAAGVAFAIATGVWHQLSRMERTATVSLVTGSLMTIGVVAHDNASPAMKRLSGTTLLLAVPAFGLTVGLWMGSTAAPRTSILIATMAAFVAATPLYSWQRSSPQQVALFLTTLSFCLSLVMRSFESVPGVLFGALAFLVGAGWVAGASVGWITPRLTGEIAGAVASLIGSMVFFIGLATGFVAALAFAVAVAVGTVTFGVVRSRIALTIVGIVALASYVPWLASEILGPSIGTPFILVTAAMTLVLWATRRTKRG